MGADYNSGDDMYTELLSVNKSPGWTFQVGGIVVKDDKKGYSFYVPDNTVLTLEQLETLVSFLKTVVGIANEF